MSKLVITQTYLWGAAENNIMANKLDKNVCKTKLKMKPHPPLCDLLKRFWGWLNTVWRGIEEIKQLIVCPPLPLFVVQEGPRGPMIETSKIEKVETKLPMG